MSYKHAATKTVTTSQSYTFNPRPFRGQIAVQCHGGDARLEFGTGSATAVNNAGVRVIADQAPLLITLDGADDTVACVADVNAGGAVTVEIMTVTAAPVPVSVQ